jgi:uncharacterized membrane protein YfhO
VYYPKGWTVKIDDKPGKILQTNFVLRGVVVPKGKHTVTFNFEPKSVEQGATIAYASSAALVVLILGALFMAWRNRLPNPLRTEKEQTDPAEE